MKLTIPKALALGAALGLSCVLMGAVHLATYVGQFVGEGSSLTNVAAVSMVVPLDGVHEINIIKHDTHGIDLDYKNSDGSGSTALFRTVDAAFHFVNIPYIDDTSFWGNALGVNASGQLVSISGATIINNFFSTNLFTVTNFVDYFNSYSNAFITFQSNTIFNQNITVKGNATVQTLIITNSLLLSTNAFPLTPGTTWNWAKKWQRIDTNADFNVTAITGLSNNYVNEAELLISNTGAGQMIAHLTFSMNKFGPNTTNDLYIGGHKQAYVDGQIPALPSSTNIVTIVEQ
jgi:hypothetical protein